MGMSGLGILFKEAAGIYKLNIKKIISLVALICLPVQLLYWFASEKLDNSGKLLEIVEQWQSRQITDESMYEALIQDGIGKYYIYLLVTMFISVLGAAFTIAIIRMTADTAVYGGIFSKCEDDSREIVYETDRCGGVQDYFSYAVKRLPKYLWTAVVAGIIVVGGFFMCIFPGIIAAAVSLLGVYVVSLTSLWGIKAFRFSAHIIRRKPVLLFFYIICTLVQELAAGAVVSVFALFNMNIITSCIAFILTACVMQIFFSYLEVFMTLLFMESVRSVPELEAAME